MGAGASAGSPYPDGRDGSEFESGSEMSESHRWKLLPSSLEARRKYEEDGTLSKESRTEHLELRILLDDTYAQQKLGAFAKKCRALDIFMCWVDIQEFKAIPTIDYRRSKALHIYHKYIKAGAVLEIGAVDSEEKDAFKSKLDEAKETGNASLIDKNFFSRVQTKCFIEMYHNIFKPFRESAEDYVSLNRELKAKYNRVEVDDFDYIGKLGEGGFGLVVHVKKRSTGKHYAMKIQTKYGLIDSFQDDPWRADFEKQAFASCHHPFIVGLDYAFQTDLFAFMVLGLSTAGDLSQQLTLAPEGFLCEDRVRFYAAEICLALIYLHEMGLIYRDLKPNNVLLNADGHIQLVDLGGVVDERGETLGKRGEEGASGALSALMRQHFQSADGTAGTTGSASSTTTRERGASDAGEGKDHLGSASEDANEADDLVSEIKPKRKLSIMGTFGYMAPEMVVMMSQNQADMTGYNDSVDWWSLGVTVYKLLTGLRPFTNDRFQKFVDICGTMTRHVAHQAPEYAMLFQEVTYPPHLSAEAVNFIERLLDVNDNTRLGAGPRGIKDLKAHPFFEGIDWELLEQRHMVPPYKPLATYDDTQEEGRWPTFHAMMTDLGKAKLFRQVILPEEQKYFANWDFVSPYTLRRELGLANEMSQLDANFKVRKLLGSDNRRLSVAPSAKKV